MATRVPVRLAGQLPQADHDLLLVATNEFEAAAICRQGRMTVQHHPDVCRQGVILVFDFC